MRFEIGPGGMLLILLGLAGLSGAVFGLGLIAGHELSGPEPNSQPVAAAYPMPAAPAPAPSAGAVEALAPVPAASANPGAMAPGTNNTASATAPAANPPSRPAVASAPPVKAVPPASVPVARPVRRAATSNATVASRAPRTAADENLSTGASVAPPNEAGSESAGDTGTYDDEGETAPAAPAPAPRRRLAAVSPPPLRSSASGPYSVQIDAMMDRTGAEQMAQKMRAKGFEPYIVPTLVDGKTWYRLRVGHYSTPEEAQAAESKLHQEFDQNAGH